MARGVDVLTLTASPIPRTLEMALTGIRDLSMVNTPPADRRPILTYVGEQDPSAVSEALRRGTRCVRGRPSTCTTGCPTSTASPARSATSSPKPGRRSPPGRWTRGASSPWCSTSGAAPRRARVHDHHRVGHRHAVGQHADRGPAVPLAWAAATRSAAGAGRGGPRAYAYLFHPADRVPLRAAYERLRTIGEHTELGSAFKIAMRDLEIRGAGNLLGRTSRGTSRRWATTSTSSWWRKRGGGRARPAPPPPRSPSTSRDGAPAQGLRGGRGRPARGLPPSGVGGSGRTWTTSEWSGPTATARSRPPGPPRRSARLARRAMACRIGEITMSSVAPVGSAVHGAGVAVRRPPAPRCDCAAWCPVPPTARTWPSSWCRGRRTGRDVVPIS